MKKIFYLAAIAATFAFAACGGNTASNTAQEDSLCIDTVASLEVVDPAGEAVNAIAEAVKTNNAAAIEEAIQKVQAELQKYIELGDAEQTAKYASQIKAFIEENSGKLQELNVQTTAITDIINAVKAVPGNVEDLGNAAVEAAKADANAAAEAAKAKAEEAANKAVEDAKAKANEKVNEATNKATDAANKAINDAAAKAKSQLGL